MHAFYIHARNFLQFHSLFLEKSQPSGGVYVYYQGHLQIEDVVPPTHFNFTFSMEPSPLISVGEPRPNRFPLRYNNIIIILCV